ncbi:Trichodiene oxygenase 2 [Colletotrichum chlorophyti]|uniref:Trichodiene oxygenase 2 n=1 Tax=Colletotrichum chlorophyti TaxID=708187 RepID=A0A1Q8RRF3_9PEZI|nr:Trichodiene oxygenase 2 [Colletotrichum chlorophyti]
MNSVDEVLAPTSVLSWRTVGTLLGIWLVYFVGRIAYNLSPLHPLSKFPGPRLAAASYLYECWFDLIKKGRYTHEIRRLHEIYGPIIRINPDELHCSDVNFVDEIYAIKGRKRDKPAHQMRNIAANQALSHFATLDHDVHRKRRAAMSRFFSRYQMLKLEPEVHGLAQRLCDKLLAEARTPAKHFNLTDAYSCFTSDVIAEYCFGEVSGFLEQEDWTPNYRAAVYGALNFSFLFRYFPFLKATLAIGPCHVVASIIGIVVIPNWVEKAKAQKNAGGGVRGRSNVFAELFDSDLPPEEKTTYRLTSEGAVMMIAGTETTSFTLTLITLYVLSNPRILEKLTRELRTVVKDPEHLPNWPTLEGLPYLGAVIAEGLRLAPGLASRTARIATEEDLVYRGKWAPRGPGSEAEVNHFIPRGYAVGMSAMVTHLDERIFPGAREFAPERWLDMNGQRRRDLDKAFLPFSKGTRQCLGMSLAYAELYIALAALVLRVFPHMELYDTTEKEVEYDHDLGVPVPASPKGVRAKIST